jgi:hypothetical protein
MLIYSNLKLSLVKVDLIIDAIIKKKKKKKQVLLIIFNEVITYNNMTI